MRIRLTSFICILLRGSFRLRGRDNTGEGGSALIEMALIMSLLGIPLVLGTAEMGFFIYDYIEIGSAAHAGALYGMTSNTAASDTAGIQAAVESEAPDISFSTNAQTLNSEIQSQIEYLCSNSMSSTPTTTLPTCSGTGNHYLGFISVTVSVPVTPAIHLPAIPSTFTLTSNSVMEIEE